MAYTADDLEEIKEAKMKLLTGRRIASATKGDSTIAYAPVTPADLDTEAAKISAVVNQRKTCYRTATSKGL